MKYARASRSYTHKEQSTLMFGLFFCFLFFSEMIEYAVITQEMDSQLFEIIKFLLQVFLCVYVCVCVHASA